MVSDHRCGEALAYLQRTDEEAAELKVQVERKAYLVELARKKAYLAAAGTIEQRKAIAETSQEVGDATDNWLAALLEFEKVKGHRTTEILIVDVWRTASANRRTGNI